MLPPRSPAVMASLCDPDRPDPILHRTDVSDSHSLDSHPLPAFRAIDDHPASPIPAPATLRLADPVAARFIPRTELEPPPSADTALVVLPCRSPAVTLTALVPPSPDPTPHRTDVSDSHPLLSHTLLPVRPETDAPATPIPPPTTVMLADPVAARFALRSPLARVESADIACVALPCRRPTVKAASFVPISPYPTAHRTDVSDSHPLLSHALPFKFKYGEVLIFPRFNPTTLILIDPGVATLIASIVVMARLSYVRSLLTLARWLETVKIAVLDAAMPIPMVHCNDVSEYHMLASNAVAPTRPDKDTPPNPKFTPRTELRTDPVKG